MKPLVGQPVPRFEDARLLTGKGAFVDDLHPEGALHAAIFRSSRAHGRIVGIDTSEAVALPGVVGVFTLPDFADFLKPIGLRTARLPGFEQFLQLPLAVDKVRYVGEPLAVVVAESPYIAEDALSLISVQIEELPAISNWATATQTSTLIHEAAGTNVSSTIVGRGDVDGAFRSAFYRRRERFTVQRHTAVPMEPRGLVAVWDPACQQMTVSGITKIPFRNRGLLAGMLDLPESAVIMKVADAGGSFGVRGEFYPEDFLIPFVCRKLNRPVKWIEDRREHFLATNHSREAFCDLEIASDRDGQIIALRGNVVFDLGAYARSTGATPPTRCAQFLAGPYRIPNFSCEVSAYVSNKTPAGTYRGPGRIEANFFRERLIDMTAADLQIDPAEIRRRNLLTKEELPFQAGRLVTYEAPAEFDSGDYPALFERALEEIGWQEKQSILGRNIDGWCHGIGFACFVESGAGGTSEQARIRVTRDGLLDVFVGATSSGQGHETVFAQVCADALDMSIGKIRVICASTNELEAGVGSFHSRSAVMAGNAVRLAAQTLLERLKSIASEYFGRPNVEFEWSNEEFHLIDSDLRVTLAKLAAFVAGRGESIDVLSTFEHTGKKPFSYGANAAHVAVDPRTGCIKVVDFVAIEDIGCILNPLIAHGQAVGALLQGLGGTFLEHLIYDEDGQLLTASFADYLMPTASDFPNIRSQFFESSPAEGNPLGAKGAGEGGIVAVAAAVGNAVSAALSSYRVQVCDLPLSPPRVWQLVQEAQTNFTSSGELQ